MTTQQTERWKWGEPRSYALVAAATVLVAVAVIAGLSHNPAGEPNYGPVAEGPRGPASSPSGSGAPPSSGSATPSPTRTVIVPAEATARTEAGAVAFATYFVEQGGEAGQRADSSTLRQISGPKCSGCKTFIRLADEYKAKRQALDQPGTQVSGTLVTPDSKKDRYVIDVLVTVVASNLLDGDRPSNGVSGLARRRVSAGRLDSDDRDSQGWERDAQGSQEEDVVIDGVGQGAGGDRRAGPGGPRTRR